MTLALPSLNQKSKFTSFNQSITKQAVGLRILTKADIEFSKNEMNQVFPQIEASSPALSLKSQYLQKHKS